MAADSGRAVELREKLSDLGLSETEVDTYLALLSRGEATASTVAEDADLSQQAVYNITERLEDRGLVRVNEHASPKTIRALSPETAMANLTEQIESITPLLEERFNETEPRTPKIEMVKSRETVLKRLTAAISDAEHEVILAVPEHVYPEVRSELEAAVARDVFVLLLVGNVDDVEADAERFAGVADVVHCWRENVPFLYTVDDQTAMIGSADVVASVHNEESAVEVSQSRLTGTVLGTYLGTYWPASTEVYVTDPYPLPRTFDWFRQAALHAALHQQAGADLRTDIETVSGERVSGPVVEVRQAFVEPATNDFSLETSLHVGTEDGVVSVGGTDTFIEDYEARTVTLRADS